MMRLLLALFCAASLIFAGDDGLASKVDTLARAYVDWGPLTGTAGASLTLREFSRSGRKRVYHAFVSGLPLDGRYFLVEWPITRQAPYTMLNPVFIDASGILMCKRNGNPALSSDTINLIVDNVPGKPFRFGVINVQDRGIRALGKIVPQPIASEDGNCRLTATYLTGRGEVVFVEASGLRPEEAFKMTLHSGSQELKQENKASISGTYATSFLPIERTAKSQTGHAEIRVEAASGSAEYSVKTHLLLAFAHFCVGRH